MELAAINHSAFPFNKQGVFIPRHEILQISLGQFVWHGNFDVIEGAARQCCHAKNPRQQQTGGTGASS